MPSHDILVISDLHLGEDLRPGAPTGGLDGIERALVSFLNHYRKHRAPGRRWRLVINGDMVDLVSVAPSPAEAGSLTGLHPDAHHYGLGSRARAAVVKLGQVMQRHDQFFNALADFVGAGNDLAIVLGNHDVALGWNPVQELLVTELQARWHRVPGRTTLDFGQAVRFHPWFYFEPGRVWVEHGHQYDGYCSFDTILDPSDPTDEADLEQNLGTAVLRYVGNFLPGIPGEEADRSFVDYLRLLHSSGRELGWRLWSGYWQMSLRLLQQWANRSRYPEVFRARATRHAERLRHAARRARLTVATLERITALRTRPVFIEFGALLRALMLGRLLLSIAALAAIPLVMVSLPWLWQPGALALIATSALLGHFVLAYGRDAVDPSLRMPIVAERIRRLVRAPIVVFGHSHHAVARRLRRGWYFNTGTWLGDPGALRSFTHLLIQEDAGKLNARLCRWSNDQSRELRAERC